MRTAILFALLQAGVLLAATGQRHVPTGGIVREATSPARQAPTELVNGSSVNFTLPTFTRSTLFIGDFGYIVRVPQGATELRVRLITNSDIDMYVNFGSDPSLSPSGTVTADHNTELIPSKDLRIGLSGSPGLRYGTYHIGMVGFEPTAPNTGTIQVTISNPNPNPNPVNDLSVAIGAEDNSSCPAFKQIGVTVRDPAGALVSGLSSSSFTLTEGTAVKNASATCPSAGQCTLSYPPTDAARSADVEVKVNLNGQRTGSSRTTVGPCTASGGGGGSSGRTVTALKLEMGSLNSSGAFVYGGHAWTTFNEPSLYALGVTLPNPSAPLLNASNRSVSLSPGSYYLLGEPGGILSHAKISATWSDGQMEEAVFVTTPVASTSNWNRLSGSTNFTLGSTGLTNLNKVGTGGGIGPGGSIDYVFRLEIGSGTGGGGTSNRTVTGLKLEMGSLNSSGAFVYGGHVWSTLNDAAYTLGVTMASATAPLLNASNRSVSLSPGSYHLHGEPGGILSHARITASWSDGQTEEAVFATSSVTSTSNWNRLSGSANLALGSTGLTNLNKVGPGSGVGPGGGSDYVFRLDIGSGTGGGGSNRTATGLRLDMGSLNSSGVFVNGGHFWSTINDSAFTLGVTLPNASAPLLNASNRSVNLAPGSYHLHGEPGGILTHAKIVVNWSDGITEEAVFATAPLTSNTAWTRVSGSTGLSMGSTGLTNLNKIGPGTGVGPGGGNDYVFRLDLSGVSGGGGSRTATGFFFDIGSMTGTNIFSGGTGTWSTGADQYWRIGISLPTTGAPTINPGTQSFSISPGTYHLYFEPYSLNTHAKLIVSWSDGTREEAIFLISPMTGTAAWTRVLGSTNISLTSTGISNQNRVSAGTGVPVQPGGLADWVLRLDLGGSGGGSGGAGGTVGGGTGPGSTVTPGCNYFVTPLSATPVAAQSTGIIRVTTADNCEWNSHSDVPWLRITAVRNANGRGSGAVDYVVSANTDPSTRSGLIVTAGQTTSFTQAAGVSCTVTLAASAARVGPSAGGSTLIVNASTSSCAWTARSNDAWIQISGTTGSGTGPGRVSYNYDANASTASRNGTITVNGQTFTLTQDGGSSPGTPTLTEAGIVNSASGIPPSLPGGALAQGSFFTIFASGIGPTPPRQVEQFPLPSNLGGSLVQIRQGSRTVDCYLVYASSTQINGIIPSNAPLGDAEMIVTFNGRASRPVAVRIARNNFGIFATSQGRGPGIIQNFVTQLEQPLNTRTATARPRQVITVWGTGAGPVSGPDNVAPPAGNLPFPFEMTIGGRPANLLYNGRAPCCSGVDQIVAEVPADAPQGCFVPVQVKAGDTWSNVVTMAIQANGQTCSDPTNPVSSLSSAGGKVGVVALTRLSATANVAGQGEQTVDADVGIAIFPQLAAGGDLGFNMLTSMPPSGSCQAYAGVGDVSELLGGALGGPLPETGGVTLLDAGASLRVAGPGGGSATLDRATNLTYMGILGGNLPIPGSTGSLALDPGSYTVTGSGGKDVGAFTASVALRPALTWTNRTQLASIDRRTPFRLTWTGGTAGEDALIVGFGTDQKSKVNSGFLCTVPAAAGAFTVPASVMANLPAVPAAADLSDKFGLLGILSFRSAGMATPFRAPGLDIGLLLGAQVELRTIEIK